MEQGVQNDGSTTSPKSPTAVNSLAQGGKSVATETTASTHDRPACSGPETPRKQTSALPRPPSHAPSSSDPAASNQNPPLFATPTSSAAAPPNEGGSPKTSSTDSVFKSPSRVQSSEALPRPPATMIHTRTPSMNFSDAPLTLTPCPDSSQYLYTLNQLLIESLDTSRGTKIGPLKRDSAPSTHGPLAPNMRRGSSLSSCNIHSTGEPILLNPVSFDLIGRSGVLRLLSAGPRVKEANLEGISCYGNNVLVLIQAQVEAEGEGEGEGARGEGGEGEGRREREANIDVPTFKIGRKLTHYRRYNKYHYYIIIKNYCE